MSNLLSEEDIIQFHAQMFRVSLKKEFFAKPCGESLANVLELFLQDFGVANICSPDLNAASNIANLERYDDWIPKSNLVNAVRAILSTKGIEFGFKDLMSPGRKKLQRVLSCLIYIWYKFVDAKEKWNEIENKCSAKANDKARLQENINQLKSQIEQKSLYLSQNRTKFQHCEVELNSLVNTFEEKKLEGTALEERSREVKQAIAQEKESISELSIGIGEMKEEIFQLKHKIVRSPDKILAETQAKERELEAKRMEKRRQEKEYMDIVKNVDMVRDANKDIKPSMEVLQETFRDIELVREKCTSIDNLKEKLKAKKNKLQQLQVVKQQTEANFASLKEQMSKSRVQHQQRIRPLITMNEDVKQQIDEKKASLSINKQQEKMLDEEQKLVKEIEATKTGRQRFNEKLEAAYSKANKTAAIFKSASEQGH